MPRPKLHSDDAILDAAQRVLLREGPGRFTLSDVAVDVGISRAALIQRFTDKATLHLRVMERMTEEVRDYFGARPAERGVEPLWTMLADLISGMGEGEGFVGYLLLEVSDVVDSRLNALARERNALVRHAIAQRLPEPNDEHATLIQAVIQGATMQWLVEEPDTLSGYVLARTRAVITLLYPDSPLEA